MNGSADMIARLGALRQEDIRREVARAHLARQARVGILHTRVTWGRPQWFWVSWLRQHLALRPVA